jgi:hypothetical protein
LQIDSRYLRVLLSRLPTAALAVGLFAMAAAGQTINVDINCGSSNNFSGVGIASADTGTTHRDATGRGYEALDSADAGPTAYAGFGRLRVSLP